MTSKGAHVRQKWWLIGGGVLLVAALLVGGQLLLTRTSKPTPSPAEKPAQAPTTPAAGTASGTSTTPTTTSANLGAVTTTSSVAGSVPHPPAAAFVPPPATKPYAASGPIPPGDPLGRLTTPPERLIAGFQKGVLPAGSAYAVTLRPWGFAAGDAKGPTLVVTVGKIRPLGSAPPRTSLVGANLLVVMTPTAGGFLTNGGSYTAVLTFVAEGNRLIPMLSAAKLITR